MEPFDLHVFLDRDHKPRASLSKGRDKTRAVLLTEEQLQQLRAIEFDIHVKLGEGEDR